MTATAVLAIVALLGGALMAGLFFAFSGAVMPALRRRPPEEGMAAMQTINIAIINPVFFVAFFGPALASAAVAVLAAIDWSMPESGWLFAGSLAHLVGTILVTMVRNVPMNNMLAGADPGTEEGADLWARYLSRWTTWNHLRTILNLAATALLATGLHKFNAIPGA